MTARTGPPSAPPGVLVENTSASTATLVAEPPPGPADGAGEPPATPPPARQLPTPLRPGDFGGKDVGIVVLSALSALCLVWVVFYQVTLLSGALGFLVCWYLTFLLLTWLATAHLVERQAATDRVIAVVLWSAALLMVGIVLFIVGWVFVKAVPTIHWGSIFTKDQRLLDPRDPNSLDHAGLANAIVGTLEQMLVAAAIGVPIAIVTAVFLNEVGGRGVRLVRTVVTAMSGTPAIVAGIFIYSIFIINHLMSFSGFAAALALTIILLPSVTRVTEEVLRVVPSGLREASLALGAPQWRTVWSVVLPTARSGVVTGILLGIARIIGETAPLIFTAFGAQLLNGNVFSGPQEALPLVIYNYAQQPYRVMVEVGFQAAFVLMVLVLILFVLARVLGRTRGKRSKAITTAPTDDVLARMFVPVPIERPAGEEGTP